MQDLPPPSPKSFASRHLSTIAGTAILALSAGLLLASPESNRVAAQAPQRKPQVTVLASPELQEPVTLLTRSFSREQHVTVTAYFLPASEYLRPLSEGKNADLVIFNTQDTARQLKQRGLLDVYSLTNLVKDEVVLAVPSGAHALQGRTFAQRLDSVLRSGKPLFLVTPSATSDLGKHTVTVMEHAAKDAPPSKDDDSIPDVRRSNSAAEAAEALSKAGEGAALLYRSDAVSHPGLSVDSIAPASYHSPVMVQTAVVAGEHMEDARRLNAFLQEPEQRSVLYRYGFGSVK